MFHSVKDSRWDLCNNSRVARTGKFFRFSIVTAAHNEHVVQAVQRDHEDQKGAYRTSCSRICRASGRTFARAGHKRSMPINTALVSTISSPIKIMRLFAHPFSMRGSLIRSDREYCRRACCPGYGVEANSVGSLRRAARGRPGRFRQNQDHDHLSTETIRARRGTARICASRRHRTW